MEDRIIAEASAIMGDRPAREIINTALEIYTPNDSTEDTPTYGLLAPTTTASSGVLTMLDLEKFIETLRSEPMLPPSELPYQYPRYQSSPDGINWIDGYIDGYYHRVVDMMPYTYNGNYTAHISLKYSKPTRVQRWNKIKRRRNRAAERRRRKGLA